MDSQDPPTKFIKVMENPSVETRKATDYRQKGKHNAKKNEESLKKQQCRKVKSGCRRHRCMPRGAQCVASRAP